MPDTEFALIGLGRMGGGLALRALEKGMRVSDTQRTAHPKRSRKLD